MHFIRSFVKKPYFILYILGSFTLKWQDVSFMTGLLYFPRDFNSVCHIFNHLKWKSSKFGVSLVHSCRWLAPNHYDFNIKIWLFEFRTKKFFFHIFTSRIIFTPAWREKNIFSQNGRSIWKWRNRTGIHERQEVLKVLNKDDNQIG